MASTSKPQIEWHSAQGDHFKSVFDYLKHISTLSTGSILLLTTFLEKVFAKPVGSWLVGVGVGAFFLSLLASAIAYTFLVINYPRPNKPSPPHWEWDVMAASILANVAGFIVGIGCVAVFFLLNWYLK